jgi:hypothetical protein
MTNPLVTAIFTHQALIGTLSPAPEALLNALEELITIALESCLEDFVDILGFFSNLHPFMRVSLGAPALFVFLEPPFEAPPWLLALVVSILRLGLLEVAVV